MSEVLLQTLQSIRTDVAALHTDVCSARTEAAERHLMLTKEFGGLAECILQINERLGRIEYSARKGSAASAMVSNVADIAKAALLG